MHSLYITTPSYKEDSFTQKSPTYYKELTNATAVP